MKKPLLTIQMLNYGNARLAVPAVKSVLKSGIRNFEVLVIDNNSPTGDYEKIKKAFSGNKNVRVIKTPQNLGFSGGHDYGMDYAQGRYVLLLNDDVVVQKNWSKILMDKITEDSKTAVVGPRAYFPQENPNVEHNRGALNLLFRHLLNPPEKNAAFIFIEGASPLFDRKKIPMPFDKDYFIYHEDTYLCLLARLKGYRVKHVPESRLLHYGSQTKSIRPRAAFLHERNRLFNIFLFYSTGSLVKIFPLVLFDILGSLVKNAVTKPGYIMPHLKAYAAFFAWLPRLIGKRREIQGQRRAPDSDLFKLLYGSMVPRNGFLARIINTLSVAYLGLVGIRAREHFAREENVLLSL